MPFEDDDQGEPAIELDDTEGNQEGEDATDEDEMDDMDDDEEGDIDEEAIKASVAKLVEAMSRLREREMLFHSMQREMEDEKIDLEQDAEERHRLKAAQKEAEALRSCASEDAELSMRYLLQADSGCESDGNSVQSPSVGSQPRGLTDSIEGSICPFVPTSIERVRFAAKFAGLTCYDVVYDLGCGDGRLLLLLAEEVRCRGVGVDIDCDLIQQAQAEAAARHLSDLLDFATEDMLVTAEDLARASVLMLYLVPQALQALLPLFRKEWSRRPDLRVVSWLICPQRPIEETSAIPHLIVT